MRMFGTNGVRGIANEDMSCELSLKMGRAIVKVLGNKIAVANDPRTSSNMLKSALCSGLMSMGADVVDLGMIPTPALQHYIKLREDITGGVMITASHNPSEFNGIKCIANDGTECTKEQEDSIESFYHNNVKTVGWHEIGSVTFVADAAEEYIESILSQIDVKSIRDAKLKVALDCANGCSCYTTPSLLDALGVTTILLNNEPNMKDPTHLSEPTENNLTELLEKVHLNHADLGIAHDGDADRCVFVTSEGKYVPGDATLAILGRYILTKNNGGKIVVTVATSKVVEDTANNIGGKTIYTAVGSPIVARKMVSEDAIFGGEENGGLIFASHQFCRDGAMGVATMLECITKTGPLEELLSSLKEFHTIKKAIKCPDELKDRISDKIATNHAEDVIDRTDGLKFLYDDGWVLLRPSGTEPKYRIYSESYDYNLAKKRSEEFIKEFETILTNM